MMTLMLLIALPSALAMPVQPPATAAAVLGGTLATSAAAITAGVSPRRSLVMSPARTPAPDMHTLSPGTDRTRAVSAAAHDTLPPIGELSRRGGLTVHDLQHLLLREGWRPPRATKRTPDGRLGRPGGTKAK
eukprot:SAG11_NODE_14943_length_594_cov_0.781818_1_plen_131_part_10